jgi:hypothetical protein
MRGITASNLQSAVQTVNANRHLKNDYEAAVNYLAEANDTLKAMASAKRNVSAVSSTTGKKSAKNGNNTSNGNKKKKLSTGFMKHSDWWKLTEAQRNEIRNKRRNSQNNSNSNSNNNQSIQTVVTGVATDVSSSAETTVTSNTSSNGNQAVGAVMTRRNRGNNN